MKHFAGLDVSVNEASVCIVDETGRIVREAKVATEALLPVLRNRSYSFKRIGLEAGPLSQWLYSALGEANLPVICVETRHMRAILPVLLDSKMNAMRLTLGATSLSNSNHLPAIEDSTLVNAVALPPGRAKLSTKRFPDAAK